ncbi:MAG: hypothetical protein NWR72_08775, partial [Bacteroidia bacterium]|nr:hypothetical protein [Bacteroidia bacterium]
MKRILLLFLPLLIISLSGCKATKRAYEKGDYETAVVNSIERLRRAPDNKKARQTLKLAYPTMVTHFLEQINIAKVGGNQYKWEEIMGYYDILNRAYNEVKTAPAALEVIPNPQNFIGDYEIARTKAAEVRYVLAGQRLDYARDGDRLAAKEAHEHLLKVLLFRPGYKDAEELSLEALDLATVYVQIEHIPMHSRTLALSNEFFENQLA